MNMRTINAAEAIREATHQLLAESRGYYVIGEGVPDPKCCFGTTKDLLRDFPDRVFDMPISENGGTGICIGSALLGMRPIMVHMRVDFLMYAMDQIVNNAAKWHMMYGGQKSVPMVIRAFIGRGWGQGIQHSQNLEAMFAHVPGLKVVTPSNAFNAKGLLIAAARDNNPVIMLEHRWTHYLTSQVPEEMYEVDIGKARIAKAGKDITIVAWSYAVAECLKAAHFLDKVGISAEVVDMQSLRPMDMASVIDSVSKTGRLLVVNEAWEFGGLASEVITQVIEDGVGLLCQPCRLCNPSFPSVSTHALTKHYYKDVGDIFDTVAEMIGWPADRKEVSSYLQTRVHDIPDEQFKGPF